MAAATGSGDGLVPCGGGCRLRCHIQPRASRNAVVQWHDGALKIALTAPPVDGAANAALIAFLADFFHVPKGTVKIVSGLAGRRKTVELTAVTAEAVCGVIDKVILP